MLSRRARRLFPALPVTLALVTASGCTATAPGAGQPPTTTIPGTTTAERTQAPEAVITVTPALGSEGFAPLAPVTVEVAGGSLTDVTLTNPEGEVVAGAVSADERTWQSTELLGYDRAYAVAATAVNPDGKTAVVEGSFSTVAPRTLTYASVLPSDATPVVGVGQPIAVYFDADVIDKAAVEQRLAVTSTPAVQGPWHWFSDREVRYRPQDHWPAGTHVELDVRIYGLDVGAGSYGQEDRHIEFNIGDSMLARVDSDELLLRAYQNGQLVKTMPTALGKPGYETYSGSYVVMEQHRDYTMDSSTYGVAIDAAEGYRLEVEYASRLSNTGIFVHAAPWSVADQGVRNVSHGCLNVSTEDAAWFYENFGRGDIVEVTGTGVPLRPDDGFGDWNIGWADWLAGSALT